MCLGVTTSRRFASARTLFATATAALAFAAALLPNTSQACWDGMAISTDKVYLAIGDETPWSPEQARHWATWASRIDALVPEGKRLSVTHGFVEICDADGACNELEAEWSNGSAFTLFEAAADAFDASRKTIATARRQHAMPLTVQVAASADLDAARGLAVRINEADLGLHGFLDVGGFPASNAYAHVVEGTGTDGIVVYHVVVGAFLGREQADEAVATIETELGMTGYVRRLEQSSVAVVEGC